MTRVEMTEGWDLQVRAGVVDMFDTRLGPAIRDDAKHFAPVDTGRLEGSIDHQVVDEGAQVELQVGAFPDGEGDIDYAAAVELGFHGFEVVREHMRRSPNGGEHVVREHGWHANTPEQPYLRPALYQERSE